MLPFFGRNDTIFSYTHCYWPIFTIFNFRFVIPFFWNIFTLFSKNHGNCPSINILIIRLYIIWFFRNNTINSLFNEIWILLFILHRIVIPFIWNRNILRSKILCHCILMKIHKIRIMTPLFERNNTMFRLYYGYSLSIFIL